MHRVARRDTTLVDPGVASTSDIVVSLHEAGCQLVATGYRGLPSLRQTAQESEPGTYACVDEAIVATSGWGQRMSPASATLQSLGEMLGGGRPYGGGVHQPADPERGRKNRGPCHLGEQWWDDPIQRHVEETQEREQLGQQATSHRTEWAAMEKTGSSNECYANALLHDSRESVFLPTPTPLETGTQLSGSFWHDHFGKTDMAAEQAHNQHHTSAACDVAGEQWHTLLSAFSAVCIVYCVCVLCRVLCTLYGVVLALCTL